MIKNVLSLITNDKNIGYHDARYDIACTYIAFKRLEDIQPNTEFNAYLEKPENKSLLLENQAIKKKKSLSEIIKGYFNFLTKKKYK